MGIVTSIPNSIKIQISVIQSTKSDYILDSLNFENNPNYITKAISEISKNSSIQKVVLKLFFSVPLKKDLSKSILKLLNTKATVVIYGSNLWFFDHPKWIMNMKNSKTLNLQLKFELMPTSFEYIMKGISANNNIKILGFRYLSEYQIVQIGDFLVKNQSIYHLQIILEQKAYKNEAIDEIASCKLPSTPQSIEKTGFLINNKSITTFTLGGYQENSCFIMGISNNFSVKTLIFENIDIEKNLRFDWNLAFKCNSSVKEIKILRGLSTVSSLILFQSLRKNKSISAMVLEETMFFNHGFLAFERYLTSTVSLNYLLIKNLVHLNINQFSQYNSLQNLSNILKGVALNRSLVEVCISNNLVSSNQVLQLEPIDNVLNDAFFTLFTCNKFLKTLYVENFRIGSESFQGISSGLAFNSSLEHFSVSGNLIKWNDFLMFSREILKNNSLKSVDFTNNSLASDAKKNNSAVFDEIFFNLGKSALNSLKIEEWVWNTKNYHVINQEALSSARKKFLC